MSPPDIDKPRRFPTDRSFEIKGVTGMWKVVLGQGMVRDAFDKGECPLCGKMGIAWQGWFSCEYDAGHLACFPTEQVLQRVGP